MQEKLDTIIFNTINAGAIGITFTDIEQTLTILLLITALLYNLKKLRGK
ncbi:MAG: hypothetical protein Unbinned6486contig1001_21 [Prokaryotic dsDNA virus sp.]|nr:MAG: hypothetical protein Unbinned6486contig1001_21 [Prokaryotic dsDNA virus sp.]|tara:strand:+ start:4431 stop:4577 length:147 start_codon:yes stop_codon:yes gene_type:complete